MRRARRPRRALAVLVTLAAVLGVAVVGGPAEGADSKVGAAGIDTSLPATDSAVTVRGRGQFADLEVTVNQTRNLVNQAISVTWKGARPTQRGAARFAADFLQIFQCWGDPDGTNAANPGPPPEQCAFGATDAVSGGRNQGIFSGFALQRIISRKAEGFTGFDAADGVLDDRTGLLWKPFRAVSGEEVGVHINPDFNPSIEGGQYWLNPFFNLITTNEIAGGRTGANGTGAELFEVLTGLESTGLGCGQRVQPVAGGGTKAPQCWLVIVPRGAAADENQGTPFLENQGVATSPLNPRAWANRIAVPLEFNPLDSSCDINAEDRRISGTELAVPAVASWQQTLCAGADLPPYSYATVADETARGQLQSGLPGGPGLVVVSRSIPSAEILPDDPVVYAPLSLSGLVIGFNVERTPKLDVDPAETQLEGIRVAELNLTPRIVAKLLTQSYRQQTAIKDPSPYEWAKTNPTSLATDPDFLRFNPEFELLNAANVKNFGGLVLPSRNADSVRQVWEWILADPEATAWLAGAPDEFGMVVNPVYATVAERNSSGSAFASPVPEAFPKSDPHCYQGPLVGAQKNLVPPLLCGTDWLPYSQSYRDAARFTRVADDQARTTEDAFAFTADRVWRPDGPQILGSRTILSMTDTASAAQFGVQTARLSRAGDDGAERRFIAADEAGLLAGLQTFANTADAPVPVPDPKADVAGAYPLTMLATAAIAPLSLEADARSDYAAFLEYAAGDGQVRGLDPGQLPQGYAPLPAAYRELTAAAAKAVRTLTAPVAEPEAPTTSTPSSPLDLGPALIADFGVGTPLAPLPVVAISNPPSSGGATVGERLGGLAERVLTPFTTLAAGRFAVPVLLLVTVGALWAYAELTGRIAGGGRLRRALRRGAR